MKLLVQLTEAEFEAKLFQAATKAERKREPTRYVNSDEACIILGKIHKNTLRALRKSGEFPGYRRGREIMFKRQELYDYLENNKIY